MKKVIVGTTPTLVASAGDRDFIDIYNNDSNQVFVCFDGTPGAGFTQGNYGMTGWVNGTTIVAIQLTVPFPMNSDPTGAVVTGTGVPSAGSDGNAVVITGIDSTRKILTVNPFTSTADNNSQVTLNPALSTSTGWPIEANGGTLYVNNDGNRNVFNKEVWAISAAGNAEIRVQGI